MTGTGSKTMYPRLQFRVRRRFFGLTGAVIVAIAAGLFMIWLSVPRQVTLFTGPEGSATHADGLRYEALIEPRGVSVNVVPTAGGVETLELLAGGSGTQIGFALAGISRAIEDSLQRQRLSSLGAVAVSPLWAFRPFDPESDPLVRAQLDLAGAHAAIGLQGSQVHLLMEALIELFGLTGQVITEPYDDLTTEQVYEALSNGELDAAFVIGEPDAPNMQLAWGAPGLEPVSFEFAPALATRAEGISVVSIPAGALDLNRGIPRTDLKMIAAVQNIVVTDDIHPAIVDLVLDAMHRVHDSPTLLTVRGEFPNPDNILLPLNETAEAYYTEGPNPFAAVFPYWLAKAVQKFWLVVVAIVGGLIVLLQLLPVVLSLPFLITVQRYYQKLESIEKTAGPIDSGADIQACLADLAEVDRKTATLWVPPPQRAPFFELRQNIHDMRDRLRSRLGAES